MFCFLGGWPEQDLLSSTCTPVRSSRSRSKTPSSARYDFKARERTLPSTNCSCKIRLYQIWCIADSLLILLLYDLSMEVLRCLRFWRTNLINCRLVWHSRTRCKLTDCQQPRQGVEYNIHKTPRTDYYTSLKDKGGHNAQCFGM